MQGKGDMRLRPVGWRQAAGVSPLTAQPA